MTVVAEPCNYAKRCDYAEHYRYAKHCNYANKVSLQRHIDITTALPSYRGATTETTAKLYDWDDVTVAAAISMF